MVHENAIQYMPMWALSKCFTVNRLFQMAKQMFGLAGLFVKFGFSFVDVESFDVSGRSIRGSTADHLYTQK